MTSYFKLHSSGSPKLIFRMIHFPLPLLRMDLREEVTEDCTYNILILHFVFIICSNVA